MWFTTLGTSINALNIFCQTINVLGHLVISALQKYNGFEELE